jgi:transcription factor SPN1
MSKRERMEALRAKKRQVVSSVPTNENANKEGDDDEDSYNSAEYIRTKEDLDFIDTEGDDADAVAELYAEQNFEDEREAMEEPSNKKKKKIKGAGSSTYRGRSERAILEAEADEDDPILQAVNKLKKKKKVQKKYSELEEEAKPFLAKMDQAAEDDEEAISQKRPALKKLMMIDEVCETLARRDMHRPLLDQDLLIICKRWIQPLPNGQLGNITVRQRLVGAIGLMTGGENGINSMDLKRSDFGKVVMSLYMHKSETKSMKRALRSLIDQWSRPIFSKSGNMRDLERVQHSRGDGGLSQISRGHMIEEQNRERALKAPVMRGHRGGKDQDLNSLIQSGSRGKTESGINRVRIPYSKGFQYSVRPENRVSGDFDKRRDINSGPSQDSRGKLAKRMIEKGRTKSKNQRSANISIEGRATK